LNRIAPVAALSAYRSPWNVVVNTTSLVTVAAPYGEDGSLVSHSIFPVSWLTVRASCRPGHRRPLHSGHPNHYPASRYRPPGGIAHVPSSA
jgi:hypothetical protein